MNRKLARIASQPTLHRFPQSKLFQPGVLRFCCYKNWNVGVGVFPEREKILIGRFGFGALALQNIGARQSKMSECTPSAVLYSTAVTQDFLELRSCGGALTIGQICIAANVNRIDAGVVELANA